MTPLLRAMATPHQAHMIQRSLEYIALAKAFDDHLADHSKQTLAIELIRLHAEFEELVDHLPKQAPGLRSKITGILDGPEHVSEYGRWVGLEDAVNRIDEPAF
jgi:hypothetical protein